MWPKCVAEVKILMQLNVVPELFVLDYGVGHRRRLRAAARAPAPQ